MNMTNETAQKVAKAIKNHDTHTISSAALQSGIARNTLQRKLNGGTEFGVYELVRIAMALDVPPGSLLPVDYHIPHEARDVA